MVVDSCHYYIIESIQTVLACTSDADCSCSKPICSLKPSNNPMRCTTTATGCQCSGKHSSFLVKLKYLNEDLNCNEFHDRIVMSHISLFRDFYLSCYQFFYQYQRSRRRRRRRE